MLLRKRTILIVSLLLLCFSIHPILKGNAEENKDVLGSLRFRHIGPVGNRLTSVVGIPDQPNIYYVGAASGGIWKTIDGGIHWDPIFDSQPVSSIGARALWPRSSAGGPRGRAREGRRDGRSRGRRYQAFDSGTALRDVFAGRQP